VLIAVLCAALAAAAPVGSAPVSPTKPRLLLVGAAEDAAKSGDAGGKMALAGETSFDTIRITSIWRPGETTVSGDELATLQTVAGAATTNGIRLIASVYPYGSATTPRYATTRKQFAAYAASIPRLVPSIRYVIVGNEPNLNRFWMPQFTKKGLDAAASSYLGLLAQTYDAIKAAAPATIVIGGSLAPRGSDNPRSARPTHSPTRFILDLGKAYRLSGRRRPVMDWFAIHPYPSTRGSRPRLRIRGRRRSRSPTTASWSSCSEGRSTGRASAARRSRSSTTSSACRRNSPTTSGSCTPTRICRRRWTLSTRQRRAASTARRSSWPPASPTSWGSSSSTSPTKADLDRWQSGIYYADDTPKSDFSAVRSAAVAARAGTLVKSCR
jgi:hypothetical protein